MTAPASSPSRELRPLSSGEVARILAERWAQNGPPLQIAGGRTSLIGPEPQSPPLECLSTVDLARVIDYPARDMTVTVEAGVRVETLQALLAEQGQRLPIDIPEPHRGTIGGAIATNVSGPGRFGHGGFRDYVIGIRAVDGQGRLFAAGGRVVKNVAGYDLCKLLVGSQGTLAVITEVTLKLRPSPQTRQILWLELPDWEHVERGVAGLLQSATRPVAVEVLNPQAAGQLATEAKLGLPIDRPVLAVAYEGTPVETDWQIQTVTQELQPLQPTAIETITPDDAAALWLALTEYQAASDDPLSFQATLRPSQTIALVRAATECGVAVQAHAGNGVVIGHLPDSCTTAAAAGELLGPLARLVMADGGHLRVLACDPDWRPSLPPLSPPRGVREDVAHRLKLAFDPRSLLNPHVRSPGDLA